MIAKLKLCICCSLWLLGTSVFGQQLITVGPIPKDPRLTFPQVETRVPGTMQRLIAPEGGKATWTILRPFGFREATVTSDTELTVTVPAEPLWVLADLGDRSQLVVVNPSVGPTPPVPPGPGPDPKPPVPPTPDVVPDTVKNELGIGVPSWKLLVTAKASRADTENLGKVVRDAAYKLYHSQITAGTSIDLIEAAVPAKLADWWREIRFLLQQKNDIGGPILSRDDWTAAWRELATSLEAVK